MKEKSNNTSLLLLLLFITLPFYSVRFGQYGISLTFLAMGAIIVHELLLTLFRSKRKIKRIQSIDTAHYGFILAAIISSLLVTHEDAALAIIKTIIYFCYFLAVRNQFVRYGRESSVRTAIKGAMLGTMLFLGLSLVAIAAVGLRDVEIGYYSFTVRAMASLNALLGVDSSDFTAKNVMRNSIGEIFAFFTLLPFILGSKKLVRYSFVFACITFVLVLLTFSRRATADVVIVIVALGLLYRISGKTWLGLIVVIFGSIFLVFYYGDAQNRFIEFGNDARYSQFLLALEVFNENIFFGAGYGAKLPVGLLQAERYVHNWWLANVYMLGIPGFIFVSYVTFLFWRQIKLHRLNLLLLVVLVNIAVGSTVSGTYTPVQWTILALCFARYNERKTAT